MDQSFATAMRRALEQTRAGDPAGATRTIRAVLAPGASPPAPAPARRRDTALIEDAEIVEDRPRAAAGRVRPTSPDTPPRLRMRLGEAVRALRHKVAMPGLPDTAPAAPPPVPEGARYETRSHSGRHGQRDYRLYVPAHLPDGPQGLVLMLHGCTQNPDDFARGTGMNAQAERHGLIVAYPHQTRAHNAQACWNWFRPGDQTATSGEPAILAGLAREVAAEFGVPDGRIFAAGLSAGGAMAAILGRAHPELFAAVGVHSGLPPGAAHDVVSAFAAMRGEPAAPAGRAAPGVRTIVFHGTADATVHPANADALVAASADIGAGAAVTERGHGGGRAYQRRQIRAADGRAMVEQWTVDGLGHAWSGGDPSGSHTDPSGPDASAEMTRFFMEGR